MDAARAPAPRPSTGHWPPWAVLRVTDALGDALVAADGRGEILYANPAAHGLLGWRPGTLVGRPVSALVPDRLGEWFTGEFNQVVSSRDVNAAGRQLSLTAVRRDGTDFGSEFVLSLVPRGKGDVAVVVAVRRRDEQRLARLGSLTQRLFDTLADPDALGPPEDRVLAVLGRELGWEVAALWLPGAPEEMVRIHLWVDPEADPEGYWSEARPRLASKGATLPLHVLSTNEPLWVPDLRDDARFSTGPAAAAGLVSAVVFPIHRGGAIAGVVELFSTERRDSDPGLVHLVRAVSGPVGELLSALRRAEEREQLLAELESARRDQAFLLRASRVVAQASDYRSTIERLAEVAVPVLADLCLIDIVDETGAFRRMAGHHHDPSLADLVRELCEDFPPDPSGVHPIVDIQRRGGSRVSAYMSDQFLRETTRNARHFEIVKAMNFESYMAVPLIADGKVLGTVTLVSAGSGRRFSSTDLAPAEQLAFQVASVVERARRHEHDQKLSHTFQRSLLPETLHAVPGLVLASRYEAAGDHSEVGGDWYDVVTLHGRVALVVGDVAGHDMEAAAVMAKVRHGLSAILVDGCTSPAAAIDRLNHFVLDTGTKRLTTVLVALIEPRTGEVTFASAGHLPPLILGEDGASFVDVEPNPPIGFAAPVGKEVQMNAGTGTLLMFTDGLVESRERSLDEDLAGLLSVAGSAPRLDPGSLCDYVLTTTGVHRRSDDIAMLAARLVSERG